jgi:Tfp pilus assembly protein PilF
VADRTGLGLTFPSGAVQDVYQLFRHAELQMNQGSPSAAVETLHNLLAIDPDHALAHAYLAMCLQELRRPEGASFEMRRALKLAPEDHYVRYTAGRIELMQGWDGAAERHLDRARELAPENPAAYRLLAIVYAHTGRPELVLPTLQEALNAEPHDAGLKTDIASHLLSRGQIEEAEALALGALRDNPECADAQVLLGDIRFHSKDYDDARGFALGALHIDPSHEGALTLLCFVKLQKKSLLWRWRECARRVGQLHYAEKQELKRVSAVVAYIAVLILFAAGHPWAAVAAIVGISLLLAAAWAANRLVDRIFDRELKQVRFHRRY